MSTFTADFREIAEWNNAPEIKTISGTSEKFKKHTAIEPKDVLGMFKKVGAVPLVRGGYVVAKTGITPETAKKYLRVFREAWDKVELKNDPAVMVAHLSILKDELEDNKTWTRKFKSAASVVEALNSGEVTLDDLNDEERAEYLKLEAAILVRVEKAVLVTA